MKLKPRLKTIADMINGELLCDIGTDHAYLPVFLFKEAYINNCVLTDINYDPIKKARRNMVRHLGEEILSRTEYLQGDGLMPLFDSKLFKEADKTKTVVAIAGMGGNLIREILIQGESLLTGNETIIIQPMTKTSDLLEWSYMNGYEILRHRLAKEGHRFYNVIKVRKTGVKSKYGLIDIYAGSMLLKENDPHIREYLTHKASIIKKIMADRKGSAGYEQDDLEPVFEEINKILKGF